MLRLYINDGIDSGSEYLLADNQDRYLLIGRAEDCDIRLDRPRVADHHALIGWADGGYYLVDQRSGRETLLNGRLIDSEWLEDGDTVEIGRGGPRLTINIDSADGTALRDGVSVPQETQQIINQAADHIGLYDPTHDTGRPMRSFRTGLLIEFFAFVAMLLLGLMGLNMGVSVAFTCTLVATVPALFYLALFLWLDRFDPEPPMTLAFAFGWGATISVLFSGYLNDLATGAIGDMLTGIIIAPFVEEFLKGLGVFLVVLIFRKDFDSVVDGIIYAGVAALGFATMENVDYYGRSLARGGFGELMGTFFVRGLMAPFSHVLFTSMTGIGFGIARETNHLRLKVLAPAAGFGGAVLLHSLWNSLASFDRKHFIVGYVFLEVPLFIAFLGVIVRVVMREGRILRQTLTHEVERGLISQQQLDMAISVFAKSIWILSAVGKPELLSARRRFLRTVSKLGLCLWHRDRAAIVSRDTGSLKMIDKLRAEILILRDKLQDQG